MIWVKCIGVDEKGRVKLSRKAAMKDRNEEAGATPGALEALAAGGGQSEQSPDRDRGRGDRGGRDRERSRERR